jgi:hypothetical protein
MGAAFFAEGQLCSWIVWSLSQISGEGNGEIQNAHSSWIFSRPEAWGWSNSFFAVQQKCFDFSGYFLDLSYIAPNLIASARPSTTYLEQLSKNPINDLVLICSMEQMYTILKRSRAGFVHQAAARQQRPSH